MKTSQLSMPLMIRFTKSLITMIIALILYGCFSSGPKWESNLGSSEFPHTVAMITDQADNSYVVSQFGLTKVDAEGNIVWVINSDIIEDETASFAKFIEKNGEELSVFLFSNTTLYQLAIDETGNILSNQSYTFPEDITLVGPQSEDDIFGRTEIDIVKHNDDSYGLLNHTSTSIEHNYFRLDDSGLTLLTQFQLEDLSVSRIFNDGKQFFISNGDIDCVTTDALRDNGSILDSVMCFDSFNGAMTYQLEIPDQPHFPMTNSYIMGDKLAWNNMDKLEIHDLSNTSLIQSYPNEGYASMLAADSKGILIVYTTDSEIDTEIEDTEMGSNAKLALISWQGNEIWSKSATNILPKHSMPVNSVSAGGKYFITYFVMNEDDDSLIERTETIEISAHGNKTHTYEHQGAPKPPLENPNTKPAIITISSNGKPRMLSFIREGDNISSRHALLYVQQF